MDLTHVNKGVKVVLCFYGFLVTRQQNGFLHVGYATCFI